MPCRLLGLCIVQSSTRLHPQHTHSYQQNWNWSKYQILFNLTCFNGFYHLRLLLSDLTYWGVPPSLYLNVQIIHWYTFLCTFLYLFHFFLSNLILLINAFLFILLDKLFCLSVFDEVIFCYTFIIEIHKDVLVFVKWVGFVFPLLKPRFLYVYAVLYISSHLNLIKIQMWRKF